MNIRGFTIIELLITIIFLAVLVSIATGSGCVGPRYKCVDGFVYEVKTHRTLDLQYDTNGKPKACRK